MQTLKDELKLRINQAEVQYHRLVILLKTDDSRSNYLIKKIAFDLGIDLFNLGLDLSKKLLDCTERQKQIRIPQMIEQMLIDILEKPVILNHIEILFQPDLKQDPLRLLQGLSRNRIIIAIWNGNVFNNNLTYAIPEHPEYSRYPIRDLNILSLSDYSE